MAKAAASDRLNILQRLNKVQQEVTYLQKEKAKNLNYAIMTHDKVTATLRPHLVELGVLYYPIEIKVLGQNTYVVEGKTGRRTEHRCEAHVICRFVCIDDKEDYIDVHGIGHGVDTGDKGPGKAVSYAVKYILLKAFGLETGEADESEYDQEERSTVTPEQLAIEGFQEAIAMAKTADELRAIATQHGPEMKKLEKKKEWKAQVLAAQGQWQARMAAVKKAEKTGHESAEEETAEETEED